MHFKRVYSTVIDTVGRM